MKTIYIFLFMCLLFFESKASTSTVTSVAGIGSLTSAIPDANSITLVIDVNIPGAGIRDYLPVPALAELPQISPTQPTS